MKAEIILAALASITVISGALIQVIKVIVDHTTDKEFDSVNRKIARLERRQAMLEIQVKGDSDTFSPHNYED